jgi:hypothetical protein
MRSLPLTFYILALPYLLVYRVFPTSSGDAITTYIVLYLIGIIILQILGSIRAYYSWKVRDYKIPSPPALYVEEKIEHTDIKSRWCSCFHIVQKVENKKKKAPIPTPPNTFDISVPSNIIEIASLTLEFFQMAVFPLQNDPFVNSSQNEPTSQPTFAPSGISESSTDSNYVFWGQKLYEYLYIDISYESSDITYASMWGAVALVGLLLVIFATQFLFELRLYGALMKNIQDKDRAKDSFFYSFTGAVVYGHGTPNNITDRMRLVISVLSDALFLVISLQLLQVFACEYEDSSSPTLLADSTIICWDKSHNILAVCSLISYAFYVPLSIMITPMLLEAPRKEDEDSSGGVTYLKLYLMTINVIKSVMLLVTVMGPQVVSTSVISSTVASLFLGSLTVLWFQSHKIEDKHYSAELHPCNISFINYWKAASYTAAVVTAIVVIFAHEISSFTPSTLSYVLFICWITIIFSFTYASYSFSKRNKQRNNVICDLIVYPFYWRDTKELTLGSGNGDVSTNKSCVWLFSGKKADSAKLHIPGCTVSPWYDYIKTQNRSPICEAVDNSPTEKILQTM